MTVDTSDLVLDPYDYDFHEDPYPYYRRLRDEAPLYRNDELGFWALSRHSDVLQGFRNSTALSNKYGVSLDPISRTLDAHKVMSFLALDDPAHLRLRTLVSKGFTPRRIRELEPRVTEIAVQHLDTALQSDTFDYVDEFAGKLPMDVISELMGVPEPDRARIRALADGVMHRDEGLADVPASAMQASADLMVYYAEMVAERRKKPSDDLTSALLEAEIDGDRLTDDEIMAFLFLMVVAGNETTTKLLANAAYWGWKNPDQLAPVYADHSKIPLWVEETLRYDTSSQILARAVAGELYALRHHAARRRRAVAAARFGQPRRPGVRRRRRIPHRPRNRFQTSEFRQRRPLLPRRPPGPHGGPGGADRVVQANPRIRGRRGQRRPRPFEQRPRVRPSTHSSNGPLKGKHAPVRTTP